MPKCYFFRARNKDVLLLGFKSCEYPHWIEVSPNVYTPGDTNKIIDPTWESEIGTIKPVHNKAEILQILKSYENNRLFLSPPGTWEQSQAYAQSLGGNLVTIENQAKNDLLTSLFGASRQRCWIGLTDRNSEGVFKWVSGKPVTYTNWSAGEPNNYGTGENYTEINFDISGSKWNDLEVSPLLKGIVEINYSLVFNNYSNAFESQCYAFKGDDINGFSTIYFACCSDPSWLISRANNAYFEPGNGSNYLRTSSGWATSKGEIIPINNISELYQIAETGLINNGINPPFYYFKGFKYFLTSDNFTWEQAQAEAQALGGNLITIDSEEKNKFINTYFSQYGRLLIGFTDKNTEGNFRWASGRQVSYTNWFNGEPNNTSGLENYTEINFTLPGGGKWNDINDLPLMKGIIEIAINPNDLGCSTCLNLKKFPAIKADRISIKLPNYYNFAQEFNEDFVFVKASQHIGANAEVLIIYELINEISKKEIEDFYTFNRNFSFTLDLNLLRIPQNIKDVINNWNATAFIFKEPPIIQPVLVNRNRQAYNIEMKLNSVLI